jgi:hypothetical protein
VRVSQLDVDRAFANTATTTGSATPLGTPVIVIGPLGPLDEAAGRQWRRAPRIEISAAVTHQVPETTNWILSAAVHVRCFGRS